MNNENLIPLNKRPQKERKEIQRKGAEASNRKQAERRKLKEVAEIILSLPVNEQIKTELQKFNVKEYSYPMALVLAQIKQALKGNTKAFNTIVELLGENDANIETKAPIIIIEDLKE
ncbi:MAG: hypothetical protein ACI4VF_09945 [Lachnospirales bacterium]